MIDIPTFLNEFFEHKDPEAGYIQTWTLSDKRSGFFQDIADAIKHIESRSEEDHYICVGLSPKAYSPNYRCKANHVVGVAGFYVDIDIAGPAHKKAGLPPDQDAAISLVVGQGQDPSILVHTGHGVQAWWLFKEILYFDTPEERDAAASLSRRLGATIRERAKEKGWTVDSVHDLARLGRIPGTLNCKLEEKVRAKIILQTGLRYTTFDLEDVLVDDPGISSPPERTKTSELVLQVTAEPPWHKITPLFDVFPTLEATLNGRREDLPSASEYDLAIASMLVKAGLNDQEIANAIIAGRRRRGDDLKKALRGDYIGATTQRARSGEIQKRAEEELGAATATPGAGATKESRETLRERINEFAGINILKLEMMDHEDPTILLTTDQGEVMLPSMDDLLQLARFRKYLAIATRQYLSVSPKKWGQFMAPALLRILEVVEVSPESKGREQVRTWLRDYLEGKERRPLDEIAITMRVPFIWKGHWHIFLDKFHRWARMKRGCELTQKKLSAQLRLIGCNYRARNANINGKDTSRGVWKLPEGYENEY